MNKKFTFSICMFLLIFSLIFLKYLYAEEFFGIDQLMDPADSKTISMDFKNAALNDVLKIFSQQSGLSETSTISTGGSGSCCSKGFFRVL